MIVLQHNITRFISIAQRFTSVASALRVRSISRAPHRASGGEYVSSGSVLVTGNPHIGGIEPSLIPINESTTKYAACLTYFPDISPIPSSGMDLSSKFFQSAHDLPMRLECGSSDVVVSFELGEYSSLKRPLRAPLLHGGETCDTLCVDQALEEGVIARSEQRASLGQQRVSRPGESVGNQGATPRRWASRRRLRRLKQINGRDC